MTTSEIQVTKAILREFFEDFMENIIESDVVVVGAGPCGIAAATYAAEEGHKTILIERNFHAGGGMWQGGFLMPKNIIREPANILLEEWGVKLKKAEDDLYVCDSFEMVSKMLAAASSAGVKLLNSVHVEDIILKNDRVEGVVIQWFPATKMPLDMNFADPIAIKTKVVIDATGHGSVLVSRLAEQRPEIKKPVGCGSMWVDRAEQETVELTHEIYPGLIVAGMAATSTYGAPRMGPIFSGMLLGGKKAAEFAHEKISEITEEKVRIKD